MTARKHTIELETIIQRFDASYDTILEPDHTHEFASTKIVSPFFHGYASDNLLVG